MRIITIHSGTAAAGQKSDIAVKCCMCHRVQVGKHWMTEVPGLNRDALYSHGYCPSCYAEAIEELAICPVAMP
jgi:hypothetical protein